MPRIQPIAIDDASETAATVLKGVSKKLGSVPNLFSTMAHSATTLQAYLDFSQRLASGTLKPRLREQISLVVGEANHCDYCVAAHTALGKGAGLSVEETVAARQGDATDSKEQAAITFAKQIVDKKGFVDDEDLRAVREAGFSEGEITEIVSNVALNIFTNYFNHVAQTEVDFPAVPELV